MLRESNESGRPARDGLAAGRVLYARYICHNCPESMRSPTATANDANCLRSSSDPAKRFARSTGQVQVQVSLRQKLRLKLTSRLTSTLTSTLPNKAVSASSRRNEHIHLTNKLTLFFSVFFFLSFSSLFMFLGALLLLLFPRFMHVLSAFFSRHYFFFTFFGSFRS